MDLERGNVIAPYVGLTEPSDLNKNILICVPKINEGLTGVKRHEDCHCRTVIVCNQLSTKESRSLRRLTCDGTGLLSSKPCKSTSAVWCEINDDETEGKRKGGNLPDRPARPADGLYLSATLQPDLLKCRTEACLKVKWSTPAQKMINLARIHDKYGVKKFWEEKIESHVQRTGNEDSRMKNSALSKCVT
ncbi:uncharacterized protein LOC127520980 isoform X2 [Ctenopharyngodon idella]|uniref:uncharacterized protein LOC127520980 isoform X2 n=1 Tax=Ctenopharyngodon idella TaxID=7959 RepID=UPI00222E3A14|nr:uncharacterized protein LOC127520980 isoform X2 [Ctenopharyngodon idella]